MWRSHGARLKRMQPLCVLLRNGRQRSAILGVRLPRHAGRLRSVPQPGPPQPAYFLGFRFGEFSGSGSTAAWGSRHLESSCLGSFTSRLTG